MKNKRRFSGIYRLKMKSRGDIWMVGMPSLDKRGNQRGFNEGVYKTRGIW